MEGKDRTGSFSIIDKLLSHPHQFGFFQAVRLLHAFEVKEPSANPARLRFRSNPTLSFPASEIAGFRASDEMASNYDMLINFMGFIGPSGVLPHHYTELVIERITKFSDEAMYEFLDVFNHRFVELFYEVWQKYRLWMAVENNNQKTSINVLRAVTGIEFGSRNHQKKELPENFYLYYSGMLGQRPVSTLALEQILSDFFSTPVKILQYCQQWISIPEEQLYCLGHSDLQLGQSTYLGDRMSDYQHKITVQVYCTYYSQLLDLLPGSTLHQYLNEIITYCYGDLYAVDIQIILNKSEVPPMTFSEQSSLFLGYTSWLGPQINDPQDVVYKLVF